MTKRFAAIDFETANWQPTSVCSVGIVVMNGEEVEDSYYSLIRPVPNFYGRKNTKIHGLSRSDTDDAPAFPTVWREVAPKVKGIPLVAHNCVFDERCLKASFALFEMPYPDYRFYCTLRLAREYFKGLENYQLHTVSAHCGYVLENHHNALADAEAAAVIMGKVLGQCPELFGE
ncbi:3'-5' exonuclease [Odoribacter lunatus]|uniref:3'-5' exonuclease n=1 Tax=Odoribacter lunatus TaxID=2941335 RepID=UPI00203C9170|nr:3'-5' exonuclease [Odoribacter lunatus]